MRLGALAGSALASLAVAHAARLDIIPPLPLESDLDYEFGGSTVLARNSIRLTGDIRGEKGWIVSPQDEQLPESFELELDFSISGAAKNLYGDGMALWFLESPVMEGSMMGLSEFYNGVAVVIDTYRNGAGGRLFPRLQLLQNDGTKPYDRDNDGSANELASCGLRGIHNNNRQDQTLLRLVYTRSTRTLVAEVNYRNKWERCFEQAVNINPTARIALSAATGDLHEAHTITRMRVTSLVRTDQPYYDTGSDRNYAGSPAKNIQLAPEPPEPEAATTGPSSTRKFFRAVFRLVLVGALIYAVFFGYKTYQQYKKNQEDELYKLS